MDSKKLSTTKKKTPRKLVYPPLLTTKRSKDNLTTGTPRLSTKHLSSHKHLKT